MLSLTRRKFMDNEIYLQKNEEPGEREERERRKQEREKWEKEIGGTATAAGRVEDKGYGAKIADAASTAKDYVTERVSEIGDKISDLKNTEIKEVANQAKDYAREKPGQAILISAAAGFVLGLLIRGNRR
jgi:ElaB/YqjD/DUF883 family membrane-anchored ribosome-binding protein